MPEQDSQSVPQLALCGALQGLPYAVYVIDGGAWGLIQGGKPRTIATIRWRKVKPDLERHAESASQSESANRQAWEAKKDELCAAILRLCREFGYTNESTYDYVHLVVDSISPEP